MDRNVPGRGEIQAIQGRWQQEIDELATRLVPFGLTLTETQTQRLCRYCLEVYMWRERCGLLSRGDVESIVRKHVAASLGVLLLVTPDLRARWIDIGTGAGLPGFILKIWEPSQEIVLVEGSRKKGVFLQHLARTLDLGNVEIHTARVETLIARGTFTDRFDVLLTRAVADLKTTLRIFGAVLLPGGRIVTFKGLSWKEDVRDAVQDGILLAGRYQLEQVVRVPWAQAHLLSLRKETTE